MAFTEHSYDGRAGWLSILILNQPCQHFKWEETGVPGENDTHDFWHCQWFDNDFEIESKCHRKLLSCLKVLMKRKIRYCDHGFIGKNF